MSNLPKADTVATRKSYHPTGFNNTYLLKRLPLDSFYILPLSSFEKFHLSHTGIFPMFPCLSWGQNSPKFVLHYFKIIHTHTQRDFVAV